MSILNVVDFPAPKLFMRFLLPLVPSRPKIYDDLTPNDVPVTA